jgi:hypothetical protein
MNVNKMISYLHNIFERYVESNPKGKYMKTLMHETISLIYREHYLLLWVFFASLYLIQIFSDSQIYSILDTHRTSILKLKDENQRLKAALEKLLQDEEAKQENIYQKELKKVKEEIHRDYEKRFELMLTQMRSVEQKISVQKARVTKLKKHLQDKIEELEDNLSIVDLREDSDDDVSDEEE